MPQRKTDLYDVYLAYSSEDVQEVCNIATMLTSEGVRVWFDQWEIVPGDDIKTKLTEGLRQSRKLVLCVSLNTDQKKWPWLEAGAFHFSDPREPLKSKVIPIRLDETPISDPFKGQKNFDWYDEAVREAEFPQLFKAAKLEVHESVGLLQRVLRLLRHALLVFARTESASSVAKKPIAERSVKLDGPCQSYAVSADELQVLTGHDDNAVRLWDMESGRCLRVFVGHSAEVWSAAWRGSDGHVLSAGFDHSIRMWDVDSENCIRIFNGHTDYVWAIAVSKSARQALTASDDTTVRLWGLETGDCIRVLRGHEDCVVSVAWGDDQRLAVSGSEDKTIRLWDVETGKCINTFEGHKNSVRSVAWSDDHRRVLSGSCDHTVRLWDVEAGKCICVLEGHEDFVRSVSFVNSRYAISGSWDNTVRLWDIETGRCHRVLRGHQHGVYSVACSADKRVAYSGDGSGEIRIWDLSTHIPKSG